MTTPARRRAGAVAACLVAAGLLVGCTSSAGDGLASTSVDLERAERAWADPWFAPSDPAVATVAYGSNGQVDRAVGSRTATYPDSVQAAASLEVSAASAAGWQVVSSACDDAGVTVQLTRGDDMDDAVLAEVVAEEAQGGAETTVSAQVPHHADGSWPTPEGVDGTCADGGATGEAVTLPATPLEGDGAQEGGGDVGWQREEPDADEAALLEDLAADDWVASLGDVDLTYPSLRTGDNRRIVSPTTGELAGTDVATVVDDMTDWEPVWAACSPGTTDVRLRLVTEHGVAVVQLLSDASTDGAVAWSLAVPAPEAPVPPAATGAPVLEDRTCLSPGAGEPEGLTVTGTPVALLTTLQPIAG